MATQASLTTIQSLYVAYYGRPADPEGLQFWANHLDSNEGELTSIINAFGNSAEYTSRFGSNTPAQSINTLYKQLFGRDAEPEGLNFHLDLLNNGQKSLAEIALQLSLGAQGGDKTVFEGRTIAANAFTEQLNTPEKVAAYASDRGIAIGQQYLQRVNEQTSSDEVLKEAAPVVETLLPETNPEPEPETPSAVGGGGGISTPAPTFTATLNANDAVIFGGTATGPITLTKNDTSEAWIFTRGGVSRTLDSKAEIKSIALDNLTLTAKASLLDKLTVKGSGNLTLTNLKSETDLSGIDTHLTVTATVTSNLDISANDNLGAINTYQVSNGATLTMTLEQYAVSTVSGDGAFELNGTIEALLEAGATLIDATSLIVTDAASIQQLTELTALNPHISYTSVKDTAVHLIADAETNSRAGTFVTDGIDVVVEDEITIEGLDAVYAAVGENSTVIADDLTDVVGKLIVDNNGADAANSYITEGTNVTINGAANVAQVMLVDAANGDGKLTYSLEDSYAHIAAADSDLLDGASAIKLTGYDIGVRTVQEIEVLLSLGNLKATDGTTDIQLSDLTYTLNDTSAALSGGGEDTANIVTGADSVTANDDAFVSQARTIYERKSDATYNITDSATSILSDSEGTLNAVNQAVTITATGSVSAQHAQALYSIRSTETMVYNVSDDFASLTNGSYSNGVAHAIDLTNTTSYFNGFDAANAQILVTIGNSGTVTLGTFQDNVSAVNSFLASDANARSSELIYNFRVRDSGNNITDAIDSNSFAFINGNPAEDFHGDARVQNIEVTGTFDVEDAEQFWNAVNDIIGNVTDTASRTDYNVKDAISAYTNDVAARDSIQYATQREVTGTSADISQAQSDNRTIFDLVEQSNSDFLTVTAEGTNNQTITGGPGNNSISVGDGNNTVTGGKSSDIINGGSGRDIIYGGGGNDTINAGAGNDTVYGGSGNDTIVGGAGSDTLYGGSGRDTIYAGTQAIDGGGSSNDVNRIIGGEGGDNMFGSTGTDIFLYEGSNRSELMAESGTTSSTRDYITNFSSGDRIQFNHFDDSNILFFGSGSANAGDDKAGLSIRYETNINVIDWDGASKTATRILIDIADNVGDFDDIADMHIILIGENLDINWDGSINAITFGG